MHGNTKLGKCVDCGTEDQSCFAYGVKKRCKKCQNKCSMDWAKKRPERVLASRRKYWKKVAPKMREWRRSYYKKYGEKRRAGYKLVNQTWRTRNRIARNASARLQRAVKLGRLIRPTECSQCSYPCKPHGHHEDYEKPLEVIWLCQSCHRLKHSNI